MPRPTSLPEPRLELAPLIDVVFVLLTFFILAMVASTRFDVTDLVLPEARTGSTPAEGAQATILLTLDENGGITVDGASAAAEEASGLIDGLLAERPEAAIVLAPDREAPTGDLLGLLDELSAGGHTDVRVLREPAPGGAGPAPPTQTDPSP